MTAGAALTALVLAGTRPGGDPLAKQEGVGHKAMIDIGGKPMLAYVLKALSDSNHVARIAVAIEQPELIRGLIQSEKPVIAVPVAEGPSASVALALTTQRLPLLITTADHPLLRTEWIDAMIADSPANADVVVALAPRYAVEAVAVRTRRTYLRFSDGDYAGCNLFLLRSEASLELVKLWSALEADRKHPVRMLRRLGFGYAVRYRLGLLSLDRALRRLGELAGARLAYVRISDGLAAVDVDTPQDLQAVRQLLSR